MARFGRSDLPPGSTEIEQLADIWRSDVNARLNLPHPGLQWLNSFGLENLFSCPSQEREERMPAIPLERRGRRFMPRHDKIHEFGEVSEPCLSSAAVYPGFPVEGVGRPGAAW